MFISPIQIAHECILSSTMPSGQCCYLMHGRDKYVKPNHQVAGRPCNKLFIYLQPLTNGKSASSQGASDKSRHPTSSPRHGSHPPWPSTNPAPGTYLWPRWHCCAVAGGIWPSRTKGIWVAWGSSSQTLGNSWRKRLQDRTVLECKKYPNGSMEKFP